MRSSFRVVFRSAKAAPLRSVAERKATVVNRAQMICLAVLLAAVPTGVALGQAKINRTSTFQFSERWFEQSCFGQLTEAMARRSCQELLAKRIELANESVSLTDDQQQKLLIAGQIDIQRFFADFDSLKREFEFRNVTAAQWEELRPQVNTLTEPYSTRIVNGLNGEHSLYAKTLAGCVDPESVAKIQAAYLNFSRDRYALKINQTLSQIMRTSADRIEIRNTIKEIRWKILDQSIRIDLSKAPETASKTVRESIVDLMLQHTSPPEFYGNSRNYVTIVSARMNEIRTQIDEVTSPVEINQARDLGGQKLLRTRP